jgi:hypothetical protein
MYSKAIGLLFASFPAVSKTASWLTLVKYGLRSSFESPLPEHGGDSSTGKEARRLETPFAPYLIVRLDPPLKVQDCDERPVQNYRKIHQKLTLYLGIHSS